MPWKAAPSLLIACLALAAVAASTGASPQPIATYPEGVLAVTHTHVAPGADFEVQVETDGRFDAATVALCRFKAPADEAPEVCWVNLKATPDGATFHVDTAAGAHPAFQDGWTIGYKVDLRDSGGARAHAPLDGNYYKVLVAPAPEGDRAAGAPPAADAPAVAPALLAAALLAGARLRRPA